MSIVKDDRIAYVIRGGRPIEGTLTPGGNKNAALPMLAATLLSEGPVVLVAGGLAPRVVGGTVNGEIDIDGQDVRGWPMHRLAELVVSGLQDPGGQLSLIAETVFGEVAFGPANLGLSGAELDARVDAALAAPGMRWRGRIELGLETPFPLAADLGVQVEPLSGLALDGPFMLAVLLDGDFRELRVEVRAEEPSIALRGTLNGLLDNPSWDLQMLAERLPWPLGSEEGVLLDELVAGSYGRIDDYGLEIEARFGERPPWGFSGLRGRLVAMALAFAFTNGFHDAANAIATLVASRAARPLPAILMASIANLLGPFLLGAAVANTVAGIVTVDPEVAVPVIGAGLTGAVAWSIITWYRGIPSSSSHALVGGLVGAAVLAAGLEAVAWGPVVDGHIGGVLGILGGAGITVEHAAIRHMLNMESVITYEGTETVHQLVIGRELTGINAF